MVKAQLLDVNGNAIPSSAIAALKDKPEMGADLFGMRSAVQERIGLLGFTPEIVASLLADAAQGNSQQWQEFCHLLEQRDTHYLAVLMTRKMAVSQLPITVQDAGDRPLQKKQGEFVRSWLKKGILREALFDILDAIAKGYSVHEIQWNCETGNYYPSKLIYRPQRWFEISNEDGETLYLRADAEGEAKPENMPDAIGMAMAKNLNPLKSFVHKHRSWSGLLIDQGIARLTCFTSLFKLFASRDWGIFCQAFGMPIRVGKFGASATEEDRRVLFKAVQDIGGTLGCTIPESMNLEFIEARKGDSGSSVYDSRVKWLDEQISKAVLGQTGTTDARTGTHAAAQTHRLVQEDIERADALLLSSSVNKQLVKMMIDFSFGAPEDGEYPAIVIGRPDEAPLQTVIDAVQKLGPQGLKVKADDVLARLNLDPAKEGDATVGIVAQAQNVVPAQVKPPEEKNATISPSKVPAPTNKDIQTLNSAPPIAVDNPNSALGSNVRLSGALEKEQQGNMTGLIESLNAVLEKCASLEEFQKKLDAMTLPEADLDDFRESMQNGILAGELAGMASIIFEPQSK